jgi:protein involved in polysaccharide export with SLBB domain
MKKLTVAILASLLLLFSFVSVTAQETAATAVVPIKASVTAPATARPLTEIYRVGAGDILDIRLLNLANNKSSLFTVSDGGVIDLPMAGGTLTVAGFTPEEIQSFIAAELKRRAVDEKAQVSVSVRQYLSHSVTVTGLVIHPGTRFLRLEMVPLYVFLAESQL